MSSKTITTNETHTLIEPQQADIAGSAISGFYLSETDTNGVTKDFALSRRSPTSFTAERFSLSRAELRALLNFFVNRAL